MTYRPRFPLSVWLPQPDRIRHRNSEREYLAKLGCSADWSNLLSYTLRNRLFGPRRSRYHKAMFSRDQLNRAASLTEEDFVQLGKCRRPHIHNITGLAWPTRLASSGSSIVSYLRQLSLDRIAERCWSDEGSKEFRLVQEVVSLGASVCK